MLKKLTQQADSGDSLSDHDVSLAVQALVDELVSVETKANFLTALARKGETSDEIAAFVRELRAKSVQPPIDAKTRSGEILDVVGTGGDHVNTFNISTAAAIIAAAAGIIVAKHGNRAITSRCGSADVLEALGIRTNLPPEQAAQSLAERQFAFFFAPSYHPAFKHIGPARKLCAERGQRTLFNYLGPLLNPVRPSAMLVGTARPELCSLMARVLQSLGVRRAMVVCGSVDDRYLDELSIFGDTTVAEFYQEHGISASVLKSSIFSIAPATLEDVAGGNPQTNAQIIRSLFSGTERGPKRDAILLNAAAALFVGGATRSICEGWDLAADIIDSGKAAVKLSDLAKPLH